MKNSSYSLKELRAAYCPGLTVRQQVYKTQELSRHERLKAAGMFDKPTSHTSGLDTPRKSFRSGHTFQITAGQPKPLKKGDKVILKGEYEDDTPATYMGTDGPHRSEVELQTGARVFLLNYKVYRA